MTPSLHQNVVIQIGTLRLGGTIIGIITSREITYVVSTIVGTADVVRAQIIEIIA